MTNDSPLQERRKSILTIMLEVDTLDRGGLENVVYDLAKRLDRTVFNCVVACVNGGGQVAEKLEREGVPVEILPVEDREKAFLMLLTRYEVDVLVPHHSFVGTPLAHRLNIPVLSVLHNMYVWFGTAVNSIIREQDPQVDRYVAVSTLVRDYTVARYRIAPEKIDVIPNGMDIDALERYLSSHESVPPRSDWGLQEDDLVLLNVAALHPVKNQNLVVEALKALGDEASGVKVVCVGKILDESYHAFITEKVKAYGLEDRIDFIEFTDRIYDLYRVADIFLLPSFIEGWSLAAMEAYCFGLPMILSDVGSCRDLAAAGARITHVDLYPSGAHDLDNDAVYRRAHEATPDNIDALVEAIRRAMNDRDDAKKDSRIDLSPARAFSLENMIGSYERLLLRVIAETGKNARTESGSDLLNRLEHLFRELYDVKKAALESERITTKYGRLNEQFFHDHQRGASEQRMVTARMAQEYHGIRSEFDELSDRVGRLESGLSMLLSELEQKSADTQYMLNDVLDRLSLRNRFESFKNRFLPKKLASRIMHRQGRLNQNSKAEEGITAKLSAFPEKGISMLHSSLKNGDIARFRYRKQLKEILRTLEKGYDDPQARQTMERILADVNPERIVIYPSVIQWNHYLFQRPHHIFREMARRGYTIFFCTPDARTDQVRSVKLIEPNLYLAQSLQWVAPLKNYPVWIWVGWTASGAAAPFFTHSRVIYELIDDLQLFPFHCDLMERDHETLSKTSEVVLASADRLLSGIRKNREDALLVTNGVAVDDFPNNEAGEPPWDMQPIMAKGNPVIGYYGAISPWLDYGLIREYAKALPDLEFVFIGPDYEGASSKLPSGRNVHWLGPKNYRELSAYLACFDVATIPFRSDDVTHAVSPLKLFEYMAGGKPVVARELQELAKYSDVLLADTVEQWVEKINRALEFGNDPEKVKRYRAIAMENSWARKVDLVQNAMERADRKALARV